MTEKNFYAIILNAHVFDVYESKELAEKTCANLNAKYPSEQDKKKYMEQRDEEKRPTLGGYTGYDTNEFRVRDIAVIFSS